MTLYDDVCTPCVRKQEWRQLLRFVRKNKVELKRVDIKRQPGLAIDMQWIPKNIPLPVVVYEADGDRVAVNMNEFLKLNTMGNI